ncbi:histidinol-phosphate aminotransferase family protein [Clostridium tetani]|uniref:Histidinol-phosphate aminotransferase family protein n=2 Tax=Clostridium tetani TaxID=1513 RepID=A0ABY0EN20_CLOTA|nr:histidinol-phosphate aminotransferase family protein [Clostridium tetani]RXI69068.1 histidinol-phosphate aminotransferase family protein [Clostridium tetani]
MMTLRHGGDIYTDGILKGRKLIDFSSNINPLGIPKSFTENIQEAIDNLNKYPDIKYRTLKGNIVEYINKSKVLFQRDKKVIENGYIEIVDENSIVLGNGAAEIIDLVISTLKRIMIITPSFGEYEENAEKHGCEILYVNSTENMDYDYESILNNLNKVDGIILGNPNNPDGRILKEEEFKPILDYCEKNNKLVIIDEAFIEFVGDMSKSYVEKIKNYKCLFIIRALTKFYAMPGIRFGFGISRDKKVIEEIKSLQNPWNINAFAEVAAKYVLKDKEYIKKSLQWITEEREILLEEIRKLGFIEKAYNSNGNFILCKLKNIDCEQLYDLCLKEDIVIRKCDNYKGLDKSFVRVAIKDRQTNKILIDKLNKIWRDFK